MTDLAAGRSICGCLRCQDDEGCTAARQLARIIRAFRLANEPREPGFVGWLRWAWNTERCMNCPRRVPVVGKVWGLPSRKRLRAICDRCLPIDLYDTLRSEWVTKPWLAET